VLLGNSLNLFIERSNFQILVDVLIAYIPRGIDSAPQYFVLKCLNNFYVYFLGATPKLRTVCPHRCHDLFIEQYFVVYWQLGMSAEKPIRFSEVLFKFLSVLFGVHFPAQFSI
jgi:hypothetical protein